MALLKYQEYQKILIYKNDNCSVDVEDQHVDLNLGTHLEILDIPALPQETGDY